MQVEAANSNATGAVALTIVGVLLFTGVLAFGLWRVCKSAERAERDPKYLRRIFLFFGIIYLCAAVLQVIDVMRGNNPMITLLGLPVGLGLAWLGFRMARRVKVPPSS